MKCSNCGEEIPKDAVIVDCSPFPDYPACPKCSGQEVALNVERDVPGPNEDTAAVLELARELISGAGQLKGQKIERARIVEHLKELAGQIKTVLPNSGDASTISDVAFLLEKREHWTKRSEASRGE
jgi:hypothetical protein